ncbi:MAG: ATP synthase subunit I [Pseudomonadota bacterium]
MTEPWTLALDFGLGMLVGAAHAFLLRRAVRRLAGTAQPAVRVVGGSLARVALVVAALFLVAGGDPLGLAAALLGFTLVRLVVAGSVARIGFEGG